MAEERIGRTHTFSVKILDTWSDILVTEIFKRCRTGIEIDERTKPIKLKEKTEALLFSKERQGVRGGQNCEKVFKEGEHESTKQK